MSTSGAQSVDVVIRMATIDPKTLSCTTCRCFSYDSAWKCTGCNQKWQNHETVFETEEERRAARLPVGRDFEPLADKPEFAEIVFGQESTNALPWDPKPERSVALSGHAAPKRLKSKRCVADAAVRPDERGASVWDVAARAIPDNVPGNMGAALIAKGQDSIGYGVKK